MAVDYWKRLADELGKLASPGGVVVCTGFRKATGPETCELCGHFPIVWLFTLTNPRTHESRIVGRLCILNYRQVLSQVRILFPPSLKRFADKLNEQQPGVVTVDERLRQGSNRWNPGDEEQLEGDDQDEQEDLDLDDLTAEGMGYDETDWDAFDWDDKG